MQSLYERVVGLAETAAVDSPSAGPIRTRLTGPLNVALAGRVNAGKSTLLNALLGERLALTDATECTRVVSRYSHGQVYGATIAEAGGGVSPLPFERGPEGMRVTLPAVALPGSIVEISAPNPALRGMTLIDTPGLGSEDADRVAATTAALGTGENRESEADAVIYLLRHAHRTDVDTLEALRDRWAGNGSAFNVVAVLSRADEIGSARLDAMESATAVAARYEADGRLRGLATLVVPVSGLLAETAATLREEEFGWLRMLASGRSAEVDRLLLAASLLLSNPSSPLTVEVRRHLLDRFGLFGVRLAVARFRDGSVTDAPGFARLLVETSGLDRLRTALRQQFTHRARILQALSAVEGLRRIARDPAVPAAWVSELEEVEASSHELVEMRTLQAAIDGLLDLRPEEQRRLTLLLAAAEPATRLSLPTDAPQSATRNAAVAAIAEWRTLAANPMASRLTVAACETVARAAERIFTDLPA